MLPGLQQLFIAQVLYLGAVGNPVRWAQHDSRPVAVELPETCWTEIDHAIIGFESIASVRSALWCLHRQPHRATWAGFHIELDNENYTRSGLTLRSSTQPTTPYGWRCCSCIKEWGLGVSKCSGVM